MKKIRKLLRELFQRDRYGMVRGGLVVILVFVFALYLNLRLSTNRDDRVSEERAADAVHQLVGQFTQMIDANTRQLLAAASTIDSFDSSVHDQARQVLSALTAHGGFSDVAIQYENRMLRAEGSISVVAYSVRYLDYQLDSGAHCEIASDSEEGIRIRVPVTNQYNLVGWVDTSEIDEAMSCAYDDEYGYVIYNIDNGDILLNRADVPYSDYYSLLVKMNGEYGDTEALLSTPDGQAHIVNPQSGASAYIAQMQLGVKDWGLVLFIPEALLQSSLEGISSAHLIYLMTSSILLLAFFGYMIYNYLHMRSMGKAYIVDCSEREEMLNLAMKSSSDCVFAYDRNEDALQIVHAGMLEWAMSGKKRPLESMAALIAALELDEVDSERLQQLLADVRAGQESVMDFRRSHGIGEQSMQINLSCPGEKPGLVIGCIRDNTMEALSRDRMNEEQKYRVRMLPKSSSAWQINASQDQWRVTYSLHDALLDTLGVHRSDWRSFGDDLNGGMRNYLHADDYSAVIEQINSSAIIEQYQTGRIELSCEFRARGFERADYEWHRLKLRIFREMETGDIFANLYIMNVDAEKNAELERREQIRILHQSLTAVGGIFYGLFYIDLDRDLCYTAKAPGNELVTDACAPFKKTFDDYIEKAVHPEDREMIRSTLSAYRLRKSMTESAHYQSVTYRRRIGDSYVSSKMIIQAARFENATLRDVVLALKNYDHKEQANKA